MLRVLLFISIIVLFCGVLLSQEQSILTLSEAEKIATERGPNFKVAKLNYKQAQASHIAAWNPFLPKLSTSVSYQHSEIPLYGYPAQNNWTFGLDISLPSINGGRNFISLRQSSLSKSISNLELKDKIAKIRVDVATMFFSMVNSIMRHEVSKESLKRTEEYKQFVEKRFKLGSASELNVAEINVQLAQKKRNLIIAENSLANARENLARILGFPVDSEFTVDTVLTPPSLEDIPDLYEYLERWRENRDYRKSVLARKQSGLGELSSWLNYFPNLNFSAGYNYNTEGLPESFSQIKDNALLNYRVTASWPILSGTSRISSLMSSKTSNEINKINEHLASENAKQQIISKHRSIMEAAANYELAESQITQANLLLSAIKRKYELGSATSLELKDAEMALEEAQICRITAMADYYISRIEIQWLIGNL